MKKILSMLAGGVLALSTGAFASTQLANSATVQPTLNVSATIQTAVSLTLSSGTSSSAHCAVTAPGSGTDYAMTFGPVDALGINAGDCNVVRPTQPGNSAAGLSGDAIYWSDYTITPLYTSQKNFAATTVTAKVTTDFAAPNNVFLVRSATASSATAPVVAADFAALSTSTPDTLVTNAVSGTSLTRFLGVAVKPDNAANVLQGAQSAIVTFTLTVQ